MENILWGTGVVGRPTSKCVCVCVCVCVCAWGGLLINILGFSCRYIRVKYNHVLLHCEHALHGTNWHSVAQLYFVWVSQASRHAAWRAVNFVFF